MIMFREVDNVDIEKERSQLIANHGFITKNKNIEVLKTSQDIKVNHEVSDSDVTCTNLAPACIVLMTRFKQFTSTHARTVTILCSTSTRLRTAKIQALFISAVIVPVSTSHSKIGWMSQLAIKVHSTALKRPVAASLVTTHSQDLDARVVKV